MHNNVVHGVLKNMMIDDRDKSIYFVIGVGMGEPFSHFSGKISKKHLRFFVTANIFILNKAKKPDLYFIIFEKAFVFQKKENTFAVPIN